MGTRLHFVVVWLHWKLHPKKEGNYSGRSRVRRILLTCIQLLLIQFLDVIWSMSKNFAFLQKPLDKFFYKFDKPLTHVRKGSVKVDFTWRKFEENLKLLANKVLVCLYIFSWKSCIFGGVHEKVGNVYWFGTLFRDW